MRDIQVALAAFWGQFAPAYLAGHVPDGAALPYVVFEAARADALGSFPLAATFWVRGEQERRCDLLERAARAIPPEGARIELPGGFLILRRGSAFQTLLDDPVDPDVIGGRVGYVVSYYAL